MSTLFQRVAKKARTRYWLERHGILGCEDPLPSEQVESLMHALCEEIEDLTQQPSGRPRGADSAWP